MESSYYAWLMGRYWITPCWWRIEFKKSLDPEDYKDRGDRMISRLHDFFKQCGHLKKVFHDQPKSTYLLDWEDSIANYNDKKIALL